MSSSGATCGTGFRRKHAQAGHLHTGPNSNNWSDFCGSDFMLQRNPQYVLTLNSAGGCTFGGLTFDNFQVVPAAGNPNPEIDLVKCWI